MFPIVFPKGIFAGSPESVLVEQNVARETERNLCDWCDSGPAITSTTTTPDYPHTPSRGGWALRGRHELPAGGGRTRTGPHHCASDLESRWHRGASTRAEVL